MRWFVPALLCACVAESTPPGRSLEPGAVANETALLTVELRADGAAHLGTVSPRPILFRQPGPRFDPARHEARPDATDGSEGTVAPGTPGLAPGGPPAMPTRGPCAIVVRHASREEPVVVLVDLGHPGEGGGDVADRWRGGSVILRAPYFGAGTHYTVIRMAPKRTVALAEKEVLP